MCNDFECVHDQCGICSYTDQDRERSKNMKKIIKEYILDSFTYLSIGIWIGAGVAIGLFGVLAFLAR